MKVTVILKYPDRVCEQFETFTTVVDIDIELVSLDAVAKGIADNIDEVAEAALEKARKEVCEANPDIGAEEFVCVAMFAGEPEYLYGPWDGVHYGGSEEEMDALLKERTENINGNRPA